MPDWCRIIAFQVELSLSKTVAQVIDSPGEMRGQFRDSGSISLWSRFPVNSKNSTDDHHSFAGVAEVNLQ